MSKATTQRSTISAREKALILKAVNDKHGKLTADLVVQESDPRNPEGIAHKLAGLVGWEKPDAEAAFHWRCDQARVVIRAAAPQLIQLGVMTVEAPHYVKDPSNPQNQGGYVTTISLKSNEEAAHDAMEAEINRAVSALERAFSIALTLSLEEKSAELHAALGALGRAPTMPAQTGSGSLASV